MCEALLAPISALYSSWRLPQTLMSCGNSLCSGRQLGMAVQEQLLPCKHLRLQFLGAGLLRSDGVAATIKRLLGGKAIDVRPSGQIRDPAKSGLNARCFHISSPSECRGINESLRGHSKTDCKLPDSLWEVPTLYRRVRGAVNQSRSFFRNSQTSPCES